jgi:hypothetical protein
VRISKRPSSDARPRSWWASDGLINARDHEWKRRGREIRRARKLERRARKRAAKKEAEALRVGAERAAYLGELDVVAAYFETERAKRSLLTQPEIRLIRESAETRRWKARVRRRAANRCQSCYAKGVPLEVDHVVPLVVMLERRKFASVAEALGCRDLFRARNGQLLCRACHREKTLADAKEHGWSSAWVKRAFDRCPTPAPS